MKVLKRNIVRDGGGQIVLLPEIPEDMWHAYNLIRLGDLVKAATVRRVVTSSSSTGATSSHRVHTYLVIRVTSLEFDAQVCELHVSGQVVEENDYTKVGQFHTLDLELNNNFTLTKEEWDSVSLDAIADAVRQSEAATAIAVVMQEGLANICEITEYMTKVRQKVEKSVTRKRQGGKTGDVDDALQGFFAAVLEAMLRVTDLSVPDVPILLCSPGFTAQSFLTYLKNYSTKTTAPGSSLIRSHLKAEDILVVHSSSGHVHALTEVLASPAVRTRLADTKYSRDARTMDRFEELLRIDDGRAWYGPKEVTKAVNRGAVGPGGGALLVSNDLFRAPDVATRKRWVRVVDDVRALGGDVLIFSAEHESGKRLQGLGGVAAILTFPMVGLDDSDAEDSGEEQQGNADSEAGKGKDETNGAGVTGRAGTGQSEAF